MNKQEKLILIVAVLASFVAFLDGSVVNVALPSIQKELGGGLALQEWVVDGYLLTLGAFILTAGSLSDLFGRLKILIIGLLGFGITSLLCSIAQSGLVLILCRALQGISGALLVPSSLALITSNVRKEYFSKAIGSWTAWTGMAFVAGPLLGGFLVDTISWRLIFAINVLPIFATLFLISKLKIVTHVQKASVDFMGALFCTLGLLGPVFALIEQPRLGFKNPLVMSTLILGTLTFLLFLWFEKRTKNPMLPLSLFSRRNFLYGNAATLFIYAGLSLVTFVTILFLQQVAHFSAFQSGLSLLPVTLIMFFLSPRIGSFSGKFGPRWFMTFGPIIAGSGYLFLSLRSSSQVNYLTDMLPGIVLFGIGLATTVTPLTSAILSDIQSEHAGIASAVNNAVSRVAGLLSIAAVGAVVGSQSLGNIHAFRSSGFFTAGLIFIGGIVSAIGIRNKKN